MHCPTVDADGFDASFCVPFPSPEKHRVLHSREVELTSVSVRVKINKNQVSGEWT